MAAEFGDCWTQRDSSELDVVALCSLISAFALAMALQIAT